MKKLFLALVPLLLLAAPAAAAAPTVEIHPAQLPRGEHLPAPYVAGRVLHDGSVRIRFHAPRVTLLGTSGKRYVVHLMQTDGSHARVIWARADGTRKVLARGVELGLVRLTGDGHDLVTTAAQTSKRTRLRVLNARTGHLVQQRTFRGTVDVLDADESRTVLGGWSPNRTFWWNYRSNATQRIVKRTGYFADITADRVAAYTRDPYQGGCSVLTDLHRPITRLSRSCSERVVATTPNGRRVATVGLLSDGPGPAAATVRRARHGAAIVRYEAPYVFGEIRWQDNHRLLLDTFTTRKAAWVRCDGTDCERASAMRKSPIA